MPYTRTILFLLCLVATASESLAAGYPLFASDDPLELTLEIPIRTLLRKANSNPVLDGQLRYVDTGGNELALDISLTTRGHSRLEYCSFPPLTISLNPAQIDGTLFAGQDDLKLVTRCKKGSSYDRYLLQEFGIYRAHNLLSDRSFRARMLTVTYRDSEQKKRDEIAPGFFIESVEEVAERLGMEKVKAEKIEPSQLDAAETSIFELFQYMIANTDWAIRKGPRDEPCCHNGKVFAIPGSDDHWVVLPYDFDQAGVINTDYALPALGLGLRNVRQRLYRGQCIRNEQLPATIQLFNDRRNGIQAALAPESLGKRSRDMALRFLADFYDIINNPEKLNEEILAACRGGRKQ